MQICASLLRAECRLCHVDTHCPVPFHGKPCPYLRGWYVWLQNSSLVLSICSFFLYCSFIEPVVEVIVYRSLPCFLVNDKPGETAAHWSILLHLLLIQCNDSCFAISFKALWVFVVSLLAEKIKATHCKAGSWHCRYAGSNPAQGNDFVLMWKGKEIKRGCRTFQFFSLRNFLFISLQSFLIFCSQNILVILPLNLRNCYWLIYGMNPFAAE